MCCFYHTSNTITLVSATKYTAFWVIDMLLGIVFSIFIKSLLAARLATDAPANAHDGETYALGKLLFTQYTLPFEVVSVLLLVAMIGVILLSKKKLE